MTELNRLGAEWQTGLQLGTQPWVRSQWYQPLDYGYDRFAVVGVEYRVMITVSTTTATVFPR